MPRNPDLRVREGMAQTRALKAAARAEREARIRHLLAQGEKQADVARAVGVDVSVVSRVKRGK